MTGAAAARHLAQPALLRLRGEAHDRGDRRAHVRDAPDLRRAHRAGARTGAVALRHWLATAISFSGVALVALGATGGIGGDLGGILLGLVASMTWAAYSVAMGPLMQRYSPYRISAFMLLVGSVPLLASAFEQLIEQDWSELSALAWGCFVYSLFFSLVFTNIMWFTAIDRVGAARASLYANLQPFLGAFFALVVLSEEMGTLQIVGGLVIGAGILLAHARPAARSERRLN